MNLLDRWSRLLAGIADILTLILPILITVSIVSRYFFGSPISAVQELTEYSLLWITFLAVPLVTLRRKHVVIDLLDGLMSGDRRESRLLKVDKVAAVLSILILTAFLILAATYVKDSFEANINMVTEYKPRRWIIYSVIPVSVATAIACVLSALRVRRRRRQQTEVAL